MQTLVSYLEAVQEDLLDLTPGRALSAEAELASLSRVERDRLRVVEAHRFDTLIACSKVLEAQLSDILDFSRLESETVEFSLRPFDPKVLF